MKIETNNVMQRAERALSYWEEGSLWARLIERDIDDNDLEALQHHVDEADAQRQMQESFTMDFTDKLLSGEEVGPNTDNWPIVPLPEGFGAKR